VAGPTISAVVPTHGRPAFLRECLLSILGQTCPPDEIVVAEDGSDPATRQVVEDLPATSPAVRYCPSGERLGQLANRRRAFQLANGDLVAMLDDDDLWEPRFLELTSAALAGHPECGFCSAGQWHVNEDGTLSERLELATGVHRDVLERELRHRTFDLQTTLFRREVSADRGLFPLHGGPAPDLALFLELGARRIPAYFLAERLGRKNQHPDRAGVQRWQDPGLRVAFWESVVVSLTSLSGCELGAGERQLLGRRFREAVVELAIARAHRGDRSGAVRALRRYRERGFGLPRPGRIGVLSGLVLGVGPGRPRPCDHEPVTPSNREGR
jgi:hypothetical protein